MMHGDVTAIKNRRGNHRCVVKKGEKNISRVNHIGETCRSRQDKWHEHVYSSFVYFWISIMLKTTQRTACFFSYRMSCKKLPIIYCNEYITRWIHQDARDTILGVIGNKWIRRCFYLSFYSSLLKFRDESFRAWIEKNYLGKKLWEKVLLSFFFNVQ